ncbi:TlpA family protein disulfide reductase [Stieleria sp. JC731]|uniref:TlpA family protein disulfide reductase n=1 Tax=Pirellulaceae TaxID=2691357 RepID=UPI001E3BC76A|nr:TlpA disulfide reductase family protein [Stieleria sp. JC731]MCC9603028.1 TlpA family protein disulfide reductase [Stieleria sp. JC731]
MIRHFRKTFFVTICLGVVVGAGCNRSSEPGDAEVSAGETAGGSGSVLTGVENDAAGKAVNATASGADRGKVTEGNQPSELTPPVVAGAASSGLGQTGAPVEELPVTPLVMAPVDSVDSSSEKIALAGKDQGSAAAGGDQADLADELNRRQLRSDFTAQELIDWLQYCDRDMEAIAKGKTQLKDPIEITKMLEAIARKKLEASLQLKNHADATTDQQTAGLRGQIQSLSHLASMGDLASAKALKALAKENLKSPIPSVSSDSRIVLIGFAIDELRAGSDEAADEMLELVNSIEASSRVDIPAVLMLAEARQVLSDYGMIDKAAAVRERILALYGNSEDPTIAQIASDAAGTAKYDRARRLLDAILDNDEVAIARWVDVVDELLADSPDVFTVRFLLESSLHLEVFDRGEFVEATFERLSDAFSGDESAIAKEVLTARQAMQARKSVVGTTFDFAKYPVIVGQSVAPPDYEGKVVLMPFWVMQIPVSLQIVPKLKEIEQAEAGRVSIIGMNLDPEESPLREFVARSGLGFPSFRSVSSSEGGVANPVAAEFGLVSMPFVAVIGKDGKVAAIDFSGLRLDQIVADELAK